MTNSSQDKFLDGRVALVTGASRGIGRAVAVQLAKRGAKLACVASRAENCADTVAEAKQYTETAMAFGVDVADTTAVGDLVGQVQKELGGLDVLINNAGITRDQILMRMSEEDFDRVIAVNLKGAWNFLKAGARTLMKANGRVVNISSVVGITGNAGQVNYAASKAGVLAMTRSLAKELASRKVNVNAIAPGFIATDMTSVLDEKQQEALLGSIPLSRIGAPQDIANAVDFLVGPSGDYITGQTLVVDGGLTL